MIQFIKRVTCALALATLVAPFAVTAADGVAAEQTYAVGSEVALMQSIREDHTAMYEEILGSYEAGNVSLEQFYSHTALVKNLADQALAQGVPFWTLALEFFSEVAVDESPANTTNGQNKASSSCDKRDFKGSAIGFAISGSLSSVDDVRRTRTPGTSDCDYEVIFYHKIRLIFKSGAFASCLKDRFGTMISRTTDSKKTAVLFGDLRTTACAVLMNVLTNGNKSTTSYLKELRAVK